MTSTTFRSQFSVCRISGLFDSRTPLFVIRDPGLLKQLTVKHFDHFPDHKSFVDEKVDVLFGNNLFMLTGDKWRDMRTTLSPAFTGSKMRQMFEFVSECAIDLADYFMEQSTQGHRVERELKDVFSRYTNDVIASCAFGIKINSFTNQRNEFFVAGQRVREFTGALAALKLVLLKTVPFITRTLDITLLDRQVTSFFRSMIIDTMAVRKEKKIFRPDMINILMRVRQGELNESDEESHADDESNGPKASAKRTWSDDEIAAQAFLFFVAGFETTSTMLTFAAYELALSPMVQQKLYEEIAETNRLCEGKRVEYETLQKMKYLDQVVNESLRKWPPVVVTDRVCNQDFDHRDDSGLQFRIEKNMSIWIPIYGYHHDPKYFADPEKFDPDRFNEENKKNIVAGTYLPFGYGPRNCIGKCETIESIRIKRRMLEFSFCCRITIRPDGSQSCSLLFAASLCHRTKSQHTDSGENQENSDGIGGRERT